jgi:hypothetical protein
VLTRYRSLFLPFGAWQYDSQREFFYEFCDSVENASSGNTTAPGPEGVGLDLALLGYANYFKNNYSPGKVVLDSHNTTGPMYSNITIGTRKADDKSYKWWEGKWPIGYDEIVAPPEYPALMSRLISDKYHSRICDNYFPGHVEDQWDYDTLNHYTGGWSDRKSQRLLFVNGECDPWVHTTVSSRFRPGGPMKSTTDVPVDVVPKGGHCVDLYGLQCRANEACDRVMTGAIEQMATWVSEFPSAGKRAIQTST